MVELVEMFEKSPQHMDFITALLCINELDFVIAAECALMSICQCGKACGILSPQLPEVIDGLTHCWNHSLPFGVRVFNVNSGIQCPNNGYSATSRGCMRSYQVYGAVSARHDNLAQFSVYAGAEDIGINSFEDAKVIEVVYDPLEMQVLYFDLHFYPINCCAPGMWANVRHLTVRTELVASSTKRGGDRSLCDQERFEQWMELVASKFPKLETLFIQSDAPSFEESIEGIAEVLKERSDAGYQKLDSVYVHYVKDAEWACPHSCRAYTVTTQSVFDAFFAEHRALRDLDRSIRPTNIYTCYAAPWAHIGFALISMRYKHMSANEKMRRMEMDAANEAHRRRFERNFFQSDALHHVVMMDKRENVTAFLQTSSRV